MDALDALERLLYGVRGLLVEVRSGDFRGQGPLFLLQRFNSRRELLELFALSVGELLRGRTTVPRCGSISLVSSFMNVDFPAPFGPVRP